MQPTKKMKRIERKKKKLAALIEIAELNNRDRLEVLSPQSYGPDGDRSQITEMSSNSINTGKNKKSDKICFNSVKEPYINSKVAKSEMRDDLSKAQCDSLEPNLDIDFSHKSKVRKICKQNSTTGKISDEDCHESLPSLTYRIDGNSQKRKSTPGTEVHKERPQKMVKRYIEDDVIHTSNNKKTFSFTDELESFRKDLERNKNKKNKKSVSLLMKKLKGEAIDKSNMTPVVPDETTDSNVTSKDQNNSEEKEEILDGEEQELVELRRLIRERKKQLKEIPNLRLKGPGKEADLELLDQRTPILPCDVQNFILVSQLGHDCPRFPKWVELKKFNRLSKTVVLIVEGASAYDYFSTESSCPTIQKMDVKAEMVSPYCYNSSIVEEVCAVPLTRQQKKNLEKKFGKEICPEALLTDKVIKVLRSAFSISSVPKNKNEEVEQKISVPSTDKFPRTELLLSAWQLIEEGYPLPYGNSELGNRYPDYVMTKDQYTEVTPSSPMWALDCEMCLTRDGNELTRVSVVDEQHKTVYESLCLPRNPIKNYLTEYSGITPKMLKGVTTRLEDIQRDLREMFPSDVILVGQSLGGDLHALKMMHPYIIDTSVIFNLTGNRRYKSKLSRLSMEFLSEAIQQRGAEGHDSVEDSLAALKLVQHKLSKSIEYGDAVLSGLQEDKTVRTTDINNSFPNEHHANEFEDLKIEVGPTMATSLFKHITMKKKTVSVIGQEETLAEYSAFVAAAHRENRQLVRTETTQSNEETISTACQQCKNNNFTLAHVILSEDENIAQVDSWMKRIYDTPPFNSLFITVLVGSHKSFANGACFAKIKKPNLKLKPIKTD